MADEHIAEVIRSRLNNGRTIGDYDVRQLLEERDRYHDALVKIEKAAQLDVMTAWALAHQALNPNSVLG